MTNMENSQIGIRRAVPADAEVLELIRRSASVPDCRDTGMATHLRAPGTYTYLAEDTEPFGFVSVGVCDLDLADGEVFEWFLSPAYQQRTLGRKLLVHGMSVLKRRACESALIWIPEGAGRARHLLKRQGFEQVGATRERNLDDLSVIETAYYRDLSDFF